MLKFVHTKPPRARSTSPAASPLPGFDGAPLSPRARDQSDPPHPSYRIRPSEADVGPWPADIGSRPTSPPGIPRTTYGAGPVRTPPPPPPHEGAHFVTDDYEDLVPWRPPVAIERTRVSFPTQSEFFSVRPFPVSDVDWDRRPLVNPAGLFPYGNRYSESQPVSPTVGQLATAHSSGEPPSERYRLGSFSVTQRKPSWQPEHTTEGGIPLPTAVETQRQKPFVTYRTGQLYSRPDSLSDWERLKVGRFPVADSDKEKPKPAPKERHVRIAPYPAEEIFIGPGSSRPRASGRDRSGSPPVTVPHSILSKHSRDRTQHRISPPSSAEERPCRSPGTIGVSLSSRERTPSPEERQLTAARPSAWGAHLSSWARHEDGASKSGVKGKKGGKCAEKADKKGNQRTEGDQGTKEKFWRPKLFSWLHGPSRHKIFASKSAQPAPPVMTSCVPQVSNDLSSEALNKSPYDRSIGQSSQGSRSVMSGYKDALNRSQDGTDELLMDLTYVTERIISMSFPSEGHDTTYAFTLKDVVRMLKTKHGDNYLVLNLSEKRQDLVKANPQVKDYGWPDHLAPPLERLCSVCKAIDAWLNADSRNVAVLHCKGGRARIAIIIAAYMHYSNICASADQALDRFAMKRFCEDKLGGLPLPSQRRYVHYFAGLLSGAIKINSNPLYLHHILIHGVPNYDSRGGCRPFIKVYQGMQPIFTSGVYNVTDNMQKVCISISPGIPLRGDILIKCYHKKTKTGQREIIWQCQFHTCAIQDGNVVFSKQELDDGFNDPRFPDNGKVEFVFGATSDVPVSVSGFKSDVTVPVDDNEDSLTRSDSYENFHKVLASQGLERSKVANGLSTQPGNRGQTGHIQGHWDGSLYTTVNKQRREELEATGLTLNGAPLQANGSLTSSVDSGYVGPRDTSYGSQHHQSELHSSSYTSQLNSVRSNYSSSGLTHTGGTTVVGDHMTYNSAPRQKASVPPLEERSQLDELLSDLLSDQVNVTTSPTSPRSPPGPQSPTGLSNSQQNTMKGAKTVTTTTRTYHTYTSTDSGAGRSNPDKVLIQRAEVTYKVPGQGEERQLYTIAGEPPELEKPRVPENAFTYTPASSTQIGQSHSFQTVERDINRTERVTGLQQSPPSHTQILPYRTDYETRYNVSEIQNYNTLDSDQTSWLHEQRQKLQRKRDGRDSSGRTEQEKQLVNELRFAQNRYHGQQSYNERDAKSPVDPYHQPPLHNGPISPSSMPVNSAPPPREFGGETGHFSTYSQSQYMESQYSSGGERSGTKPPPSPTSQRLMGPLPVQPPARTSSKDYMRSRSHSSSSNVWQTLPSDNRPIARQYSETVLDRDPEPLIQPHHSPSARNAPQVSSPGRPVGPTATTTYTTYRTIHKELRDEPMSQTQQQPQLQPVVAAPPVQAPPPQPQPPPDKHSHHNYITEVFVHRVGGDKKAPDNTDSMEDTRLDELTRSLQAATESIMEERMSTSKQQQSYQQSSSSWQEQYQSVSRINVTDSEYQPTPRMSSASESSRSRSASPDWDVPANNNQVQKSHEGPPPKPVEMIEEDRISLRPIGPGMQTLEPEISHSTSTLNRATTPTFPTSPATPPFPVSPRAVHRSAGGSSVVSPMGTMSSSQSYSQHYHQQYNQQGQQQDGSLHIDTSNRMLSPHHARSPSSGGSPHSPGNLNTLRQELSAAHAMSGNVVHSHSLTGQSSPSVYFGLSRRGSMSSLAESDMMIATPKFVKDTSKYWYKPSITRDDAIIMLRDKAPGTFVIRDSNSFPGAYGLALKVAQLPPNVQAKPTNDPQAELVRHFLIEPTPKGVRLRGCSNEPVFGSLAALVYQHSITPLALPCKLSLPDIGMDVLDAGVISPEVASPVEVNLAADLLAKGAACNVIFINTVDTESLTGPQAIAKAIKGTIESQPVPKTTVVHFKVSNQGITLTDNQRKLFFRRHYPVSAITYCGMDPQDRRWKRDVENSNVQLESKIFGFVARKQGGGNDNACHLFAELDPEQPASAIVNFITKVMIGQSKIKS